MSLRTNIPDPDDMTGQRALLALKSALREFAYEISGPQAMADLRSLDNVAASFLCDLAHLADERGCRGEQFDGFEELAPPRYESPKKPVHSAGIDEAEDEGQVS